MRGLFEDSFNSIVHVAAGVVFVRYSSTAIGAAFLAYQFLTPDENTSIDIAEFVLGAAVMYAIKE